MAEREITTAIKQTNADICRRLLCFADLDALHQKGKMGRGDYLRARRKEEINITLYAEELAKEIDKAAPHNISLQNSSSELIDSKQSDGYVDLVTLTGFLSSVGILDHADESQTTPVSEVVNSLSI